MEPGHADDSADRAGIIPDNLSNSRVAQYGDAFRQASHDQHESPSSAIQRLVVEYLAGSEVIKVSLRPGQSKTFGRRQGADQVIGIDPCLSGIHFSISCESASVILTDLASTNGTFVNGERVKETRLGDNDLVIAGMSAFRIRLLGI